MAVGGVWDIVERTVIRVVEVERTAILGSGMWVRTTVYTGKWFSGGGVEDGQVGDRGMLW